MEIICYKCSHSWDYKGKSIHYVCCPGCYSKLSLRKIHKIQGKNYILSIRKIHTTEPPVGFEIVKEDGIIYLVDKKILKQFIRA